MFVDAELVDSDGNKSEILKRIRIEYPDKPRFLKKVVPGDKLFIRVELLKFRLNNALIKGIAKVNDELVAEAEWMATVVNKNENT